MHTPYVNYHKSTLNISEKDKYLEKGQNVLYQVQYGIAMDDWTNMTDKKVVKISTVWQVLGNKWQVILHVLKSKYDQWF
jgi:hypothetical protein